MYPQGGMVCEGLTARRLEEEDVSRVVTTPQTGRFFQYVFPVGVADVVSWLQAHCGSKF